MRNGICLHAPGNVQMFRQQRDDDVIEEWFVAISNVKCFSSIKYTLFTTCQHMSTEIGI